VLLPVDSHLEIEAMCRTAISALLSLGRLAEDFREALSVRGIGRPNFDSRGQTKFRDGVKHNNGFFQLHVIWVTQLSQPGTYI
jgi:hypothetical protein